MLLVPVENHEDPRLSDYLRLTDVVLRRLAEPAGGLYIAESTRVIQRALAAGHRPRSILAQQKWLPEIEQMLSGQTVPVYLAPPELLEKITGFVLHRGALAAMHRPIMPSVAEVIRDARRVVVLEDIVDHSNVGAVFRAVAGLGADAVLVTPRCADPLYRRSVRVSMAAVLQVPWARLPEWPKGAEILRGAGFELAALALSEHAENLQTYALSAPKRVALLLGTEGDGLSRAALAEADRVVGIPMSHGVDSLNVASAAAVALWALSAQSGK